MRLALNRLSEKGEWNLAELKIEFEELIVTNAPIEISGFSLEQIDQIILGDGADATDPAILAHLTDGGELLRPTRSDRRALQCSDRGQCHERRASGIPDGVGGNERRRVLRLQQ